jgi:hypothetical protein
MLNETRVARRTARRAARRRRRRRLLVPVGLAIAVVAGLVAVDSDGDARGVLPRNALKVDVSAAPTGRAIPGNFVGFSIEYNSLLAYTGANPAALNPTFIRLVKQLAPGAPPVIRFGGDTTDWTWWAGTPAPQPPGVRYALTPQWVALARASARALGARYILGINLEADSRTVAGTEGRALVNGLGRNVVAGFELGNEPEVYGTIGWYTNSAGASVPGRPANYDFAAFVSDFGAIGSSLPRGIPLMGPASGAPGWIAGANQFATANPKVRALTYHAYPLRRCYTPSSSPTYPTIANLLAPKAASGAAHSFRSAIAVAHARGLQFRVDEVNSVSCKGSPGISDVFASALWGLDELFNLARAGVGGVNIHTLQESSYAPFAFTNSGGRWHAEVRPMYYGLLLFARAAPAGSRIVATAHAPKATLRTWATAGPGNVTHVVLENESATQPLTVAVRPSVSARAAAVERLLAPDLLAKTGVTLAGQSFGAGTTTGRLSGPRQTETVQPVQQRYVIRLAPASAAVLTLSS